MTLVIRTMLMLVVAIFFTGCGNLSASDPPASSENDSSEGKARKDATLSMETFPLDKPTSVAGFGAGALWVTDLGDYLCDDTPGVEASCASPNMVYLRKLDLETRKTLATIPLRDTDHTTVAFGAGSAWISYDNYSSPSKSSVLRLDPDTNRIVHKIPVKAPAGMAFADGTVWVVTGHAVWRIDSETNKVAEKIEVSGDVGGIAVGEETLWVASYGAPRGQDASASKEITRVDQKTGEVVATIPIEAQALEGGASDVAIGRGSAWITSVNGKLLRVNPKTNEVVAKTDIGDYSFEVEVGAGSVWTTSEVNVNSASTYTMRLTQVDPESNSISDTLDIDNANGLAIVDDIVWVGTGDIESSEGTLVKVTP